MHANPPTEVKRFFLALDVAFLYSSVIQYAGAPGRGIY